MSPVPPDVDVSPIRTGAELLGFDVKPQGLLVAQVCQARREDGRPLYRQVGVQIPRRAAKTTSTTMLALGRMAEVPDYRIISTAQTGDIARRMFRDVLLMLDQHFVGVEMEERPYRARIANGSEELRWENGSTWRPVTPSPLSYRSQAANLLIFEESGHIAPQMAADLRAGAFPTTDTRPDAQIWIIGTPGKSRAGLLWDVLEQGHAGKQGIGVVDYTIGDGRSIAREDGSLDVGLLEQVHPGVSSGLTTMEIMHERFESMSAWDFAAEYAGQWPPDASTSAIDMEAWARSEIAWAGRPERFGLAYDVEPDSSSAALVAAWRDEDGVAHVEVLEHRPEVSWLARRAHGVAKKYRVPVAYDSINANYGPAEEISRLRGASLAPANLKEVASAVQGFVSNLADNRLRHFGQASLTAAAEGASWRKTESGRLFGRKASRNPITPLVAAAVALRQFDQMPTRAKVLTSFAS